MFSSIDSVYRLKLMEIWWVGVVCLVMCLDRNELVVMLLMVGMNSYVKLFLFRCRCCIMNIGVEEMYRKILLKLMLLVSVRCRKCGLKLMCM